MECKYHKAKKALQVEYEEYLSYWKDMVTFNKDKHSKEWIEEGERRIRLLEELLYNLFEVNIEFDFEDFKERQKEEKESEGKNNITHWRG